MKGVLPVTALFVDIGGVLLNDGWDHIARRKVAKHFNLDWAEMDTLHRMAFELTRRASLLSKSI